MQRLKFDLQRFATQEISAGDTYTQNGLIYTAITDAVLNLDDDGKISGLESGKVQSTLINSENSPTITFDASDDEIKFSATENDALAVTLNGRTFYFTEGTATVTSDKVSTGATKFSIAGTHSNADYKFTVEDSAEFSITTEAFVISSEKFYVSVLIGGNTLEFGVSGTATRNFTNHTFSFSGGTTISNTFGDYTFSATANDDSGGGFSFTSKGITFTPENGGTLGISIAQGDTPIFAREFSVNGGSIFVNHANQTIGLTDGAEISLASGDYEIIAKANGDASTIFSFAGNGFTFTPQENDGSLDITIKRGDDIIFGSTVGVSGGSVTIAPSDNAQVQKIAETNEVEKISVTAGTTISLSQDDSTLKLTAKDDSAVYAWRTDKNIFYFRLDGDSADFDVALMRGDNQIVQGELTFGGTLSYSAQYGTFALVNDQKLSGDSFASLKIGDYTINAATPDKTFIFGMTMQDDGKIFVSYPS
ncbi:MAG: hypothetical protein IKP64_02175, partial [Selenomonadaceae bacterium]|nr:hypothetical protein [Selenomonadaceae bacterium]